MERIRSLSSDAGFTIVEVLIALAIFSIGLLAVGALQSGSLMATGDTARKTEAWALAEAQAAFLKGLPFYTNVNAQTFAAALTDTAGGWQADNDPYGNGDNRYTVNWRVADDTPLAQQSEAALQPLDLNLVSGTYTISKTITVAVTLTGDDPATEALAEMEFIKTLAAGTD